MEQYMNTEINEYSEDMKKELTLDEVEKNMKRITRRRKTERTTIKKSKYDDSKYGSEKKPNLELLKLKM